MTFFTQNGFKGKLEYVFIFDIAEKRERSKRWLSHITITIHTQNMLVLKATIMLHYLFNNKRSFYLNSRECSFHGWYGNVRVCFLPFYYKKVMFIPLLCVCEHKLAYTYHGIPWMQRRVFWVLYEQIVAYGCVCLCACVRANLKLNILLRIPFQQHRKYVQYNAKLIDYRFACSSFYKSVIHR